MRSLLALALILLSANQIFGHGVHNCIHDTLEHNLVKHTVPTGDEPSKRTLLETAYTPFRVVANYDFLTGVSEAQASFLKNKLIPDVVAFFSKLLSVQRYNPAGTLTLPSGKCYDATIPSTYVSPGLAADFVLFVYATLPAGGALAVGGACYLGNDLRPIAGITNFNAATINADPSQYAYQLGIIQHEITHALGFSGNLFQYWKTAPKNTQGVNWRGTQGLIINSTRVATVAQKHFNCSNVTGVEIENEGGSGSKGSHWERRTMGNEVMTASANADSRYSAFTLAFLEDSGWYKANYTMAAPLDFGKNRGCSFVFQTCIDTDTKKARFPEYCSNDGQQCSSDGNAKGFCGTQKTSTTVYNYFGDNTNSYDSFGDECPTYYAFSNGVCADTTLTPAFYLPEKYSATSKCLTGTLLDGRYYNDGTVRSGCYNSVCSTVNGVKKVSFIIGTATYDCANTGAQITNIPGYSGYLTCPDANLFCAEKSTEIINPNNA